MMTIVDCPACGAKVEWSAISLYRPFCSSRCKQIDLGAWAEEKYVIPVVKPLDDPDDLDDDSQPSAVHI